MDMIQTLAKQLGEQLTTHHLKVTTAESCTGGGIAQAITAISGSSNWFELGLVTYSNRAKQKQLGVDPAVLLRYGAVSEEVVIAMVAGALQVSHADIGIAVSGVAGPAGGSREKPVGSVWFAWQLATGVSVTEHRQFDGDRAVIRQKAVEVALMGLNKIIDSEYMG